MSAKASDAPTVAEAVTHAWEHAFNTVRDDVGFREAIWLLSQIGVAGKSLNPAEHVCATCSNDWMNDPPLHERIVSTKEP
jgi:hypothetical protein